MIEIGTSIPLAGRSNQREQLAQAATGFEAIFARQMLSSARQAGFGNDLFGSQGEDTFRQMMDEHFADLLAESGTMGLADSIEAQLSAHIDQTTEG